MTAPGALPARMTVYDPPPVAPEYMTEAQEAQFETAQIAAIVAAAGASKIGVADQTTMMLLPILRAMDPYDDGSVADFARQAAEIINLSIAAVGQIAWSAIASQLSVFDVSLPSNAEGVVSQRTTDLAIAYQRPAAAYRRRMAAGVESIAGTIQQEEEERFQALGGAAVAQGRKGKSNAEVEGTKRSPTKAGSEKSSSGTGKKGGGSSGTGTSGAPSRAIEPRPKSDRAVNKEPDDWEAQEAADRAERDAEEQAADAEFDAEQELRRQAALTQEEQEALLAQVAQHEMEVRAERMVNDDIAMASRKVAQQAMTAGRVKRYRRVLHPEMAKSGQSCGLCVAASTRIYKVSELLPIHNLCNCEPTIIWLNKDPGDQINQDDLGVLYEEAGSTETEPGFSTDKYDLKKQRYEVFDHPELGPVLRNVRHSRQDIKFSPRESQTGRET